MTNYYVGVGNRVTPTSMLAIMTRFAAELSKRGYVLRSGGADGADQAFAAGSTHSEIYPPWEGYNGLPMLCPIPSGAYELARQVHPHWELLKPSVKTLHARNVLPVLGPDLATPAKFLICWTRDGCTSDHERTMNTGGTGSAISLACMYGIPVFNLKRLDHLTRIQKLFE